MGQDGAPQTPLDDRQEPTKNRSCRAPPTCYAFPAHILISFSKRQSHDAGITLLDSAQLEKITKLPTQELLK